MDPKDLEFDKQFKNLGINKESIKSASGSAVAREQKPIEQSKSSEELQVVKRKLEYLTNNVIGTLREKLEELNRKIEQKVTDVAPIRRDIVVLKNELGELKTKLNSAKVTFGDTMAPVQTSAPSEEPKRQEHVSSSLQDEKVRIDKIFDYSNTKN